MEDMIRKIMSIDQEAYRRKQQSEKDIHEEEEKFNHELELLTKNIINAAQNNAKEKYKVEIEKQTKVIQEIDLKTKNLVKEIELKYNEFEEKIFNELYRSILSMEE